MTATAATVDRAPWKVRWATYAAVLLALALAPGITRALALRVVHGAAEVVGIDSTEPIELSPTNPPVVTP